MKTVVHYLNAERGGVGAMHQCLLVFCVLCSLVFRATARIAVNTTILGVDPNLPTGNFTGAVSQQFQVLGVGDQDQHESGSCPAGYYCLPGGTAPTPCPGGTYQPMAGADNVTDCIACPAGYYCPTASTATIICPVGTFRGTVGADDPTDCAACPGGYTCETEGVVDPLACPAGTYLPHTGGVNQTAECDVCPVGRYCPEGTMTPVNCPAGTYGIHMGVGYLGNCTVCPAGSYCISGSMSPHPCEAGTYMDVPGAEAAEDCKACPAGSYCEVETVTPTGCPPGTYRDVEWGEFVEDCGVCPMSMYCPLGTADPWPCAAGSYSVSDGLSAQSDCTPCGAGMYQNETGQTECVPCGAGLYLIATGSDAASDCQACGVGLYQTGNGMQAAEDCLACGPGQYQDVTGSADCKTCSSGTYQTGSGIGTEEGCTRCGGGLYQPLTGQVSAEACLMCPSNTFQPLRGQGLESSCQACSPFSHSPSGSVIREDCVCDLGYEGANGGECTVCNSSVWCRSGTPNKCPDHSLTNGTGASTIIDCLCLPGYYGFALNPVPCALCQTDYYCPGEAANLTLECPYGEYSLPGADSASSCFCPANASSGPGSSSVWSCTCDPGFKRISSVDPIVGWGCTHCVAGEVCYNDTVTQCPVDSYSETGVGNFMNCVCNPGFYQVENPTATLMCQQCEQGYYCPGGVSKSQCNARMTSNMQATNVSACYCEDGYVGIGDVTCQECQSPYYCTLGMPLQCPQYSASVDRSSVIQNCSCNTGYWGQNGGSCRACAPGTYKNFQGCVSCQNVVATDCAACPLGTASNDTARPSVCPSCEPGYYQDTPSLTTCKACVAGTYNAQTGMAALANCTLCPVGTYSATVGASDVSTCLACPLGKYCATTGMTAPVSCAAGTYAGETGLSACLPCPVQTYMGSTGASVCTACADGSFGDVGETFCKPLTCNANSVGNITIITTPGVSVRITSGNRLDSPNTYPLTKNFQLFFRIYMDAAYSNYGSLVSLTAGGTTLWNAYQNPPWQPRCYMESTIIGSTGGMIGTLSMPRTWTAHRLAVNENMAYLHGDYTDQTTVNKGARSTYASGAIVYAAPGGASTWSFIKDVQLVVCKCKAGYYGNGDTCTVCDAGYLAFSVGLSACTACPLGYYCPNATTQTSCAGASAGSYCGPGQAAILPCAAGYYCPDYVTKTPCPAGTYSASTAAVDSSVCLVCPAGSSCLAGSSAPQPCTSNSNSNQGGVNADSCTCNSGYRVASHSYFDFDNSTGLTVPSLGPFAGAFVGTSFSYTTTGCRTGVGGCLSHTGNSNGNVPLTNAMSIPGMSQAGTGGMTVAYWSNAPFTGGGNYVQFLMGYGIDLYIHPTMGVCGGTCGNLCSAQGSVTTGSTAAASWFTSGWKHFALVGVPNGGFIVYINGVVSVVYTASCPGGFSNNSPEFFGLQGTYDDLVVVNAALDPTQVAYLYNGARPSVLPLCTVCPAGSYCPTPASVLACPTGTYNPSTMQTDLSNCLTCPVGSYCGSTGMTAPTACPAGTYRDATGGINLASCTLCPAGTYRASTGATSLDQCLACPVTRYGPTTGLSACTVCPAGQYGDVTGLTACAVCTVGSYCSAGVKTACPYANMTSQPGGYSLLDCYCTDTNYNSAHTPTYSWRMGFENGDFTNSWTGKELLGGVSVRGSVSVVTNSPSTCKTGGSCMRTTSAGTVCLSNTWGNWNSSCGSNGVVVNPQPIVSGPSDYRISFWVNLDAGATGPLVLFPMYYWSQSAGGIWVGGGTLHAAINNGVGFTMGLGPGWKYVEFTTVEWFTLYVDGVKRFQTSWQYQFWTGGGYTFINGFAAGGSMSPFVVGGAPGLYDDITYSAPDFPYSGTDMRLYTPSVPLGSVSCSSCLAGYHQVGATCVECEAGYSCPTPTSQVQCAANTYAPPRYGGGGGSSTCNTCQGGSTAPAGSTSGYACVCPAGAYWRPNWLGNSGSRGGRILITDPVYSGGDGFLMNYYGNPGNCTTCDVGTFSGPNATLCESCPAGAPTTVVSLPATVYDCKCAKGYYGSGASRDESQNILTDCTICTAGFYSPTANSSACTQCPAGTYGATSGMSACTACPAGSYCPAGATVSITCPAGSYCPANAAQATTCAAGTYSPSTGRSVCLACTAGSYCPAAGVTAVTTCQAGTYCPAGASQETTCAAGTYGPTSGRSACLACTAGSYCAAGVTEVTTCQAGTYCPASASQETTCAAGTYGPTSGRSACVACPAGSSCLSGVTANASCLANTFQPLTQQAACVECAAHSTGPVGSISPCVCDAGYLRVTDNTTLAGYRCDACARGSHCSGGVQTACAVGMYQPDAGASECLPCPQDEYCHTAGLSAGTACTANSHTSGTGKQNIGDCVCASGYDGDGTVGCGSCPAGSYCAHGAAAVLCAATTYGPTAGLSACPTCPLGTYQTAVGATECVTCPKGSYCSYGVKTACPAGTYMPFTGAWFGYECLSCPAGDYCALGATEPNMCPKGSFNSEVNGTQIQNCDQCAPGTHASDEGQATCDECSPGFYALGSGTINCTVCDAGYFCPNSTSDGVPCPPGSFGAETGGYTLLGACALCSGDTFQFEHGATVCEQCPADSTALIPGSTSCACLSGFAADRDQDGVVVDCYACPAGSYCPGRSGEPRTCPVGHWCGEGQSSPTICPAGTYQPTEGSDSADDCLTCPAGSFCDSDGMSAFVLCTNGTYQPLQGAINGTEKCLTCPIAAYCPLGSPAYVPCPMGTYGPLPAGENPGACVTCPAGSYCNAEVSEPTPCPAGRHLTTSGGEALRDCELCPVGAYSIEFGLATECPLCPTDYFCQTPLTQQACPAHTMAPEGSYTKLSCVCEPGFSCSYHKVIQAVIVVNATVDDFAQDAGGVRTAFVATVASAAGVAVDKVIINSVTVIPDARRRLLSVGDNDEQGRVASIVVSVAGVEYIEDPAEHARGGINILGHSWEEVHLVHAAPDVFSA